MKDGAAGVLEWSVDMARVVVLKLVLEVEALALSKSEHCKSQRLVLSAKGKEQLNTSLCYLQDAFYCTSVTK